MRILCINTVPTEKNGITNVIFNLYRAMEQKNVLVDYISINTPDEAYIKEIEQRGGHVFIMSRRFRTFLPYLLHLARLIRHERYDIVHAHGNSATLIIEMFAAWLGGCKRRIAHSHNTSCNSKILHKILQPAFLLLCTHHLACGEDAGRWLFGKEKFTVVNNGVDTERFQFSDTARGKIRKQLSISENELVVAHVGAFIETKNQTFLIDILRELVQRETKYRLLLVGGGPLCDEVKEKVLRLNLEKYVFFVGETNAVADYLSASDLIVMPSLFEGVPLALVEEQANGLSCLVSENITKEANQTGNLTFLSLGLNAEEWAKKVQELLKKGNRELKSQNAIAMIKERGYDIYSNGAELKEYYQNIL